jgi:hypothetical protein
VTIAKASFHLREVLNENYINSAASGPSEVSVSTLMKQEGRAAVALHVQTDSKERQKATSSLYDVDGEFVTLVTFY